MKKFTALSLVISMLFVFVIVAGASETPGWPFEDDGTTSASEVTTVADETTTVPAETTTEAPEATTVEPCAEHTWGEWSEDGRATCEHDGTKSRVCIVCGAVDIVVEQQIDHVDADGDDRCDMCDKFVGTNILISSFLKFVEMLKAFLEVLVDLFK